MYTYSYPRPALTVDAILLTKNKETEVLLIQRKFPPFQYYWAFPGGFVDINEDLETAVYRELKEETNISNVNLKQLHTFGKIDRDPRGRTVSVVYYAFVDKKEIKAKANDDAMNFAWFPIQSLPKLAFDHQEIMDFIINIKTGF